MFACVGVAWGAQQGIVEARKLTTGYSKTVKRGSAALRDGGTDAQGLSQRVCMLLHSCLRAVDFLVQVLRIGMNPCQLTLHPRLTIAGCPVCLGWCVLLGAVHETVRSFLVANDELKVWCDQGDAGVGRLLFRLL